MRFSVVFYVGCDVVSLVVVVVVLNDVVSGRVSLVTVAVVLLNVDVSGRIFVIVDVYKQRPSTGSR